MNTKLNTFLVLCQTMNYRKASGILHLTQPAVTKQIQSLEQFFDTKLFNYDGHNLNKTDSGILLEQYAVGLKYNYEELLLKMKKKKRTKLRIGATKSIGDYNLSPYLVNYLSNPEHELSLTVTNTTQLLKMIDLNELDFAIIEGGFSKTKYDSYPLKNESFTGACSINSSLCGKTVSVQELLNQTLIVREEGSGTREILESRLTPLGYSLPDFERVIPISSFNSIKYLVMADIGITFLYNSVIKDEESIGSFNVEGITYPHEFNVVFAKSSAAERYSRYFLEVNN